MVVLHNVRHDDVWERGPKPGDGPPKCGTEPAPAVGDGVAGVEVKPPTGPLKAPGDQGAVAVEKGGKEAGKRPQKTL